MHALDLLRAVLIVAELFENRERRVVVRVLHEREPARMVGRVDLRQQRFLRHKVEVLLRVRLVARVVDLDALVAERLLHLLGVRRIHMRVVLGRRRHVVLFDGLHAEVEVAQLDIFLRFLVVAERLKLAERLVVRAGLQRFQRLAVPGLGDLLGRIRVVAERLERRDRFVVFAVLQKLQRLAVLGLRDALRAVAVAAELGKRLDRRIVLPALEQRGGRIVIVLRYEVCNQHDGEHRGQRKQRDRYGQEDLAVQPLFPRPLFGGRAFLRRLARGLLGGGPLLRGAALRLDALLLRALGLRLLKGFQILLQLLAVFKQRPLRLVGRTAGEAFFLRRAVDLPAGAEPEVLIHLRLKDGLRLFIVLGERVPEIPAVLREQLLLFRKRTFQRPACRQRVKKQRGAAVPDVLALELDALDRDGKAVRRRVDRDLLLAAEGLVAACDRHEIAAVADDLDLRVDLVEHVQVDEQRGDRAAVDVAEGQAHRAAGLLRRRRLRRFRLRLRRSGRDLHQHAALQHGRTRLLIQIFFQFKQRLQIGHASIHLLSPKRHRIPLHSCAMRRAPAVPHGRAAIAFLQHMVLLYLIRGKLQENQANFPQFFSALSAEKRAFCRFPAYNGEKASACFIKRKG